MSFKHDPKSDIVAVADIGGTQIRTALVSRAGDIVASEATTSEPSKGFQLAETKLSDSFSRLTEGKAIAGMGLASAGPIDPRTGIYSYPPSLAGWHDHSFKPGLEAKFGVEVFVGHDATMAALAETTFGKYRSAQNLIYLTISTGIGAGIITNGQMVTGSNGFAGEAGHIIIDTHSELKCGGGCIGCFEALASGTGIVNIARRALESAPSSALSGAESLTPKLIFEQADAGDKVAREVLDAAIRHLAAGISSLLSVFDPDVITLGGGVTLSLVNHWDELISCIKQTALPRFRGSVPVHITELGQENCLLGSAANVFQNNT